MANKGQSENAHLEALRRGIGSLPLPLILLAVSCSGDPFSPNMGSSASLEASSSSDSLSNPGETDVEGSEADGSKSGEEEPAAPSETIPKDGFHSQADDKKENEAAMDAASERFQVLLESITTPADADVVSFLQSRCSTCHASSGSYSSFWTIDFANLSVEKIKSDPLGHVVYQSLVNAVEPAENPKPMPFGVALEKGSELERSALGFLKWTIDNNPSAAQNAFLEYRHVNPFGQNVEVNYSFTCENPVTFRKFLTRLTLDAFGRMPESRDFALFPEFDPDSPVTEEARAAVVTSLVMVKEWRRSFLNAGLRKFADKVSGASDIRASNIESEKAVVIQDVEGTRVKKSGLTEEERDGLRDEFYQLLLRNVDAESGKEVKSYKDLLLGNEIYVNRVTKNLYNCSLGFAGDEWKACDMTAGSDGMRSSYFTSFSYLASRSSSFLADNNNYSRVATLYQFIKGSPLNAATDGPTGGDVKPLPTCLKSKDTRGHLVGASFAPIGTVQIPHTGNVCQSCHIDRNLAAGSILFRPYGFWGQIVTADAFQRFGQEIPGVPEALKAVRRSASNPQDASITDAVTIDFLASLLPSAMGVPSAEQACLLVDGEEKILPDVKSLAESLIGDGRALAGGLARHIPRSVSNIDTTNTELLQVMQEAFVDSGGRLIPVFQAYFGSETFACENRQLTGRGN